MDIYRRRQQRREEREAFKGIQGDGVIGFGKGKTRNIQIIFSPLDNPPPPGEHTPPQGK
jgi:hypothetical protein